MRKFARYRLLIWAAVVASGGVAIAILLDDERPAGLQIRAVAPSLLIGAGMWLVARSLVGAGPPSKNAKASIAAAGAYAIFGCALLLVLALLPFPLRMQEFKDLLSSPGGIIVAFLNWPYIITRMVACGLGIASCPPVN